MAFDRKVIDRYEAGGEHLAQAIRGLTREDLLAAAPDQPGAGKWTIQQVVIHLMDSDLIAADRMKRVIAEENPTLIGFDENKFASNLFYEDQSAEEAVKILAMNRKNVVNILRRLPDSAFDRAGTHNERGRQTLADLLTTY